MPGRPPPSQPSGNLGIQASFTAGELSPSLRARSDLTKYHSGAKELTNFFVLPQGGASNRPGTQFVARTKLDQASFARLIPFEFTVDQAYILEFGDRYVRFWQQGLPVLGGGGTVYEVPTPYAAADLALLKYAQSNDILTLVHPGYPPAELSRYGQADWRYATITFATAMTPPGGVVATAQGGQPSGSPAPVQQAFRYAVTAVSLSPPDESLISAEADCSNYDLGYFSTSGNFNNIAWSPAPRADHYNVYKFRNGRWALIGATAAAQFDDKNILADTASGPPGHVNPFGPGNYPSTVTYHQQRRVFGGTASAPQTLFFTRSGNFYSMDVSDPVRSDDAVTAAIAAQDRNPIQHLVPVQDLMAFTLAGAWKVSGGANSDVVTPSSITVQPQSFEGCSPHVRPLVIVKDMLYVQAKGGSVRDLAYNLYASTFVGTDISLFSTHLFYGRNIVEWAYAAEPFRSVWMIRDDGMALCLTYVKDQEVSAFTRHITDGSFRGVCVVSERTDYGTLEDATYFLVDRTLGGVPVRCIERLRTRQLGPFNDDVREAWFVDCGLRYRGGPVTTVSGLGHLEGETVSVLADGNVLPPQRVSGGAVSVPFPASVVTVGLAYAAQLETMPLDAGQPTSQGKRKRVSRIRLHLENTRGLKAGPNTPTPGKAPQLVEFKERTTEAWGAPTRLTTGQEFVDARGQWDVYGTIVVRQDNPLPCTILAIEPDYEDGN